MIALIVVTELIGRQSAAGERQFRREALGDVSLGFVGDGDRQAPTHPSGVPPHMLVRALDLIAVGAQLRPQSRERLPHEGGGRVYAANAGFLRGAHCRVRVTLGMADTVRGPPDRPLRRTVRAGRWA